MYERDQDDQARDVYMKAEDLAEIERIAESWVRELPSEAVYELAKRFHFHLALKLFIGHKRVRRAETRLWRNRREQANKPLECDQASSFPNRQFVRVQHGGRRHCPAGPAPGWVQFA